MDLEANLKRRGFLINRQEIVNVPHLLAQNLRFVIVGEMWRFLFCIYG